MKKIVLLRHGESTWNKENRFTGWTDVDLSEKGREEALAAGRPLEQDGCAFVVADTPRRQRAPRGRGAPQDRGRRLPPPAPAAGGGRLTASGPRSAVRGAAPGRVAGLRIAER